MPRIVQYFKMWSLMRWLRLALGVALVFEMIESHIPLLGVAALFFFLQAFFNFGCQSNSCAVNLRRKNN